MFKIGALCALTVLFSGCGAKIPPKFEPSTTSESGTFTVYHSSPIRVWRTNTVVMVDDKWFHGFTGNDYKRERISIGNHILNVGVNSGLDFGVKNAKLNSYTINIKKNTDTCVEVSPNIEGFYWIDALGVNKATLNWKIITEEVCEKAITIRERQ